MEEPVPAQITPTPVTNPPTTAQCPPPLPPAPNPSLPPKSKKRKLDSDAHIQDSKNFKMRVLVKNLRPHFLEVLRTPDFHNCKAAHEIREQTKLLMELYKQMITESASIEKSKNVPESQPLLVESRDGQKPQDVKPPEQPQPDSGFAKPSENKFPSSIASDKQPGEDGESHGSYVVGGSAFGWNFITYSGNEAVYYGVTKESFRIKNPAK